MVRTDRKCKAAEADVTIGLLAELYPKTFSVHEGKKRPLQLGISDELQAALDGAVTPKELSAALRRYVSNRAYLAGLRHGAYRIGLNGTPQGIVAKDEEEHAQSQLAALTAKKHPRHNGLQQQVQQRAQQQVKAEAQTRSVRLAASLASLREAGKRRREATNAANG
jgi:sRNA-binding protein